MHISWSPHSQPFPSRLALFIPTIFLPPPNVNFFLIYDLDFAESGTILANFSLVKFENFNFLNYHYSFESLAFSKNDRWHFRYCLFMFTFGRSRGYSDIILERLACEYATLQLEKKVYYDLQFWARSLSANFERISSPRTSMCRVSTRSKSECQDIPDT